MMELTYTAVLVWVVRHLALMAFFGGLMAVSRYYHDVCAVLGETQQYTSTGIPLTVTGTETITPILPVQLKMKRFPVQTRIIMFGGPYSTGRANSRRR